MLVSMMDLPSPTPERRDARDRLEPEWFAATPRIHARRTRVELPPHVPVGSVRRTRRRDPRGPPLPTAVTPASPPRRGNRHATALLRTLRERFAHGRLDLRGRQILEMCGERPVVAERV